MRYLDVSNSSPCRRMPKMLCGDKEIQGFENLCVYIDVALAESVDLISEILEIIDRCIYEQYFYNHTRWVMFFGENQGKLAASTPSSVFSSIKSSEWKTKVSKHIGCNLETYDHTIYKLHNPGSTNTRSPGKEDLALFFCNRPLAYTTSDLLPKFKAIRRRALWFFLTSATTFDFVSNAYIPEIFPGK